MACGHRGCTPPAPTSIAYATWSVKTDGPSIFSEDAERLKLAADLEHVRVLFLDALLDVLGVGVDDWRSKQVRHALQPLRALAREFDIAVVGAMHPNKRADSFRQLVSGASAFNAVSRSSLLLAAHPDNEDRRVLVRGKGNRLHRTGRRRVWDRFAPFRGERPRVQRAGRWQLCHGRDDCRGADRSQQPRRRARPPPPSATPRRSSAP